MEGEEGFYIAERGRVEAVIDRMARQIEADFETDELALVGIRRRGVPLAERLAARIGAHAGSAPPVDELKLKRYSDDLTLLHERTRLEETTFSFEVEGATVVLVDDVLFSGRTLLRAVGYLAAQGAGRVHGAVLCYRGPNEVPLKADVVGMQLDVGPGNVVDLHVPPYEEELAVVVRHQAEAAE